MSYGLVICSSCHHEVHQGSGREWFHCDTKTPMCPGASAIYPESRDQIKGKYCGADDCGDLVGL